MFLLPRNLKTDYLALLSTLVLFLSLFVSLNLIKRQKEIRKAKAATCNVALATGNDTSQIQAAIDACAGGGEVWLTSGQTYTAGTIELHSNTTLNLNSATIKVTSDLTQINSFHPHPYDFIGTGSGTTNVKILGPGTLLRDRNSPRRLSDDRIDRSEDRRRIYLLTFWESSDIEVRDVELISEDTLGYPDQYGYHISAIGSQHLKFINVRVWGYNDPDGMGGNDAINIKSSQHVLISGCDLATMDDNVVINDDPARPPSEDIRVEHCTFRGSGAITVNGGRNMTFDDITMSNIGNYFYNPGNTSAIGFWIRGGAQVSHVTFRNFRLHGGDGPITRLIKCNAYEGCFPDGSLRDVCFENFTVEAGGGNGSELRGEPDNRIENVKFLNMDFQSGSSPLVDFADINGLTIANFQSHLGPCRSENDCPLGFTNVDGLTITPDASQHCPDYTSGGVPISTPNPSPTPRPTSTPGPPTSTPAPPPPGSKLNLTFIEGSPDYLGEEWSNAIDGDIQGWDGTVTTQGSPPYAVFDLGATKTISSLRLLTDTGVGYGNRWIRDFRIQVSTAGTGSSDFTTVLSASKTTGNWETFSFSPASARYIKLIIDNPPAPDGWHQLGEIEVYGSGASDADLDNDGDVDIFDYNILVENFAKTNCGNIADIDANCKVDIFDYNIVIENFGGGGNLCGNGIVDAGEECDGTNLNNQTCTTQGFTGGTLSCISSCTFNTSQCTSSQQCTPACGSWSDAANQCGTRSCTRADCSTYSDTKTCGTTYDPRQGHPYPRTAIWQWAGAIPDWYARFDLAYTRIGIRSGDKGFIDEVRRKNPNIIWLPTDDFNCAHTIFPNTPDEWYVVDSKGKRLDINYCPGGGMADLSDLSPRVNGQRLIDALPEYLARLVAESGADGVATDGLWSTAHYTWATPQDIDLDRNGVNDMVEHGKSWFLSHWGNGVEFLMNKLRSELGNDKIIMVNSGSGDTPGKSVSNGYVREYGGGIIDWNTQREYETRLSREVFQPPIFLLQAAPDKGRDPRTTDPSKNDLTFMRYSLVQSMLFGMYYSFEHVDGKSPDHYWNNYFDEFDLDLGYPTGNMQRVKDEVWARFFDGGVAMANFSGRDVTVSDLDLRSLSGYQGPYYHFLGGQDMALNGSQAMNNGQRFASMTLIGYTYFAYHDNITTMGDGVILVRTPQTVVSDIIIEESEAGTSPTNEPTALSGGFTLQDCGAGRDYYEVRCSWNPGTYSFAIAPPGAGEARFIPNIGVAGQFEVFEWHGRLNSSTLASNVSYTINHTSGSTTKTVNQQQNTGGWNSLGTYSFNAGTAGNVTISASGANGTVMADAIMFRYIGP